MRTIVLILIGCLSVIPIIGQEIPSLELESCEGDIITVLAQNANWTDYVRTALDMILVPSGGELVIANEVDMVAVDVSTLEPVIVFDAPTVAGRHNVSLSFTRNRDLELGLLVASQFYPDTNTEAEIRLWLNETESEIIVPEISNAIDWLPESELLASVSYRGLQIYDIDTQEIVFSDSEPAKQVSWSPSGQYIAIRDGERLSIYKMISDLVELYHSDFVSSDTAWLPHSDILSYVTFRDSKSYLELLPMDSLQVESYEISGQIGGQEMVWSDDSDYFVMGHRVGFSVTNYETHKTIIMFSLSNDNIVFPTIKKAIWLDNDTIFLMTNFGQVIRWDVSNNCASGFISDLDFEIDE